MGIIDDLKMQYKTGGITLQLIFWNIGIAIPLFLLQAFSNDGFLSLMSWIQLTSDPSEFIVKPWTLLTYSFLHVDVLHLLFNMIMLNFSGRLFLTFLHKSSFWDCIYWVLFLPDWFFWVHFSFLVIKPLLLELQEQLWLCL